MIKIDKKYKALNNDIFETFYCLDKRKWSFANFIVFVMANTVCCLGCKNCHSVIKKEEKWLSEFDLMKILEHIMYYENNNKAKFSITFSYADFLLSPYRYEILNMCEKEGYLLNIYSYFPESIDLDEVVNIKKKYQNLILTWSLHGINDTNRRLIFNRPHPIKSIKHIICNDGDKYLNCIAIFHTLINNENKNSWELFIKNVQNCNINFLNLIDYKNHKYFCRNVTSDLDSYHSSPIRYDLLYYLTGKKFKVIKLPDLQLNIK